MLKNRYFTVMLILLVLLTCGILIKADSQIQSVPPKFKVAVLVECEENQVHQLQVEGAIKRELRSFGDVEIVGNALRNALWEYIINVHLYAIKDSYGNINRYATSLVFYAKVPIEQFNPYWQAHYKEFPAIHIPIGSTGVFGINRLEILSKSAAAELDTQYLQRVRDIRTRSSR